MGKENITMFLVRNNYPPPSLLIYIGKFVSCLDYLICLFLRMVYIPHKNNLE